MAQLIEGDIEFHWRDLAHCLGADPNKFFPTRGASTVPARTICYQCIVQAECLEYAVLAREQSGIWGGVPTRERRSIRTRVALNERMDEIRAQK